MGRWRYDEGLQTLVEEFTGWAMGSDEVYAFTVVGETGVCCIAHLVCLSY